MTGHRSIQCQAARGAEQDVGRGLRVLGSVAAAQVVRRDLRVHSVGLDVLVEIPACLLIAAKPAHACRIPGLGRQAGRDGDVADRDRSEQVIALARFARDGNRDCSAQPGQILRFAFLLGLFE